MADHRSVQIGQLSGGQRRRVFLARALAADPDLYLLDEPVTGVDPTTQEELMDLLEAEARRGKTVIATTHDLACAAQRFQKVATVNRRIVAHGPASLVLDPNVLARDVRRAPAGPRRPGGRPRRRPPPRPGGRHRTAFPRGLAPMIDALLDPLGYDFFVRALLAAVVVGTVCAVVGTFVVLRGIAFIGDAVAHASFPGVVAAYLLAIPFYLGAAVAAVATALAIGYVTRRARIRADTAIGVLFAGTFALGVFLYSTIDGYVADLFSFLFGYLLSIDLSDLIALTALGGLVLLIVGVFWKELLYATFDPQGAAASGLRVDTLEYLFLALVALTIVISLQAVGIILVVAMLVTPAAAAQLLTVRFGSLDGPRDRRCRGELGRGAVPVVLAGRRERRHDRPRPDGAIPGHPCPFRRGRDFGAGSAAQRSPAPDARRAPAQRRVSRVLAVWSAAPGGPQASAAPWLSPPGLSADSTARPGGGGEALRSVPGAPHRGRRARSQVLLDRTLVVSPLSSWWGNHVGRGPPPGPTPGTGALTSEMRE